MQAVGKRLAENLLLSAGALNALMLCMLLASVQMNLIDDYITEPGYGTLRWILFFCVVFPACALLRKRPVISCAAVLAAACGLPPAEAAAGRFYPVVFCGALAFWLCQGTVETVVLLRTRQTEITAFAVKEALDTMHTGLMFCEEDGWIILRNLRMQQLMVTLTGRIDRNGMSFFNLLKSGRCRPDCTQLKEGAQLLYRLPDQTVWLFSSAEIRRGRKKYLQLSASDVTERWNISEEIRSENAELRKRGDELMSRLSHLREICREEETQRARNRVHDLLGQKITVLLRSLRQGEEPDPEVLAAFADGLPGELRRTEQISTAAEELDVLTEMMAAIGVNVHLQGALPEDDGMARVCAEICTEAAVNAVRHGFAAEVLLECVRRGESQILTVSDNGEGCPTPLKEGGGLTAMRQKLVPFGGTLEIAPGPPFLLKVTIPVVGADDCGEEVLHDSAADCG